MTPKMQKEEKRSVVELPYADPEPEPVATWAIDMLLSEEEKTSIPDDILDILREQPRESAIESLTEYREFQSQLPDVIWDREYAITEEYRVKLPQGYEPNTAAAKLFLAKVDKIWQTKQRPGYIMTFRYCRICGKVECDVWPIEIQIKVDAC